MARRLLNGLELADFIKSRQAKQVRALKQAHNIYPKLVIIQSVNANEVINTYVRMKQKYAEDLKVAVEVLKISQSEMVGAIQKANKDESVHGIVVQLPLDDISATDEIVDAISPDKDVDGLGKSAEYTSATAEAIDWLLSGYGVELSDKKITILGEGRLVGAPLSKMWQKRGYDITTLNRESENIDSVLLSSQVIVSATGQSKLLSTNNIPNGAIVVDAGTASEDGAIVGDTAPELQARRDLIITPPKGGVGPLTIVLMFDHVLRACLKKIN